jgi:selenocysteine lyase/cysteine desulfurase
LELAGLLKENLSKLPGSTIVSPSGDVSSGICVVRFDGADHRKLYEAMYSQYGVACAAIGAGIRFSPHIYNTSNEVERVTAAVASLVRRGQ